MEKKIHRQHPIKIFSYTTKNFWLLLIPLAKALIDYSFDLKEWAEVSWLSILTIIAIFLFALIRWWLIYYYVDEESITVCSGVFLKKEEIFYFHKTTSFMVERGIIHQMVRASLIMLDTNSGSKRKTDIKLTVRKNSADELYKLINDADNEKNVVYSYAPSRKHLVFFSLLFSSTLSGVILIATALYQTGQIIGRELEERLLYTFNTVLKQLALGIPPLAVAIALIIIVGWLYSFLTNLLKYWRFTVSRRGDKIRIDSGYFKKYFRIININKINFLDIRHNLITLIFKISSVHIHCAGYGKSKEEIAALVPIATSKEIFKSMQLLLPGVPTARQDVKPASKAHRRFVIAPFILTICIPVVAVTMTSLFPGWSSIIKFLAIIIAIPTFWLLIVKNIAYYTTGIGFDTSSATLSYCYGYAFHTVLVSFDKICTVKIKRSLFQLKTGSCHVLFYTNSEKTKKHIVKNLPYDEVITAISENNLKIHF